ncbi:hypothetical protein ABK040_016840 [Willaertia magna]
MNDQHYDNEINHLLNDTNQAVAQKQSEPTIKYAEAVPDWVKKLVSQELINEITRLGGQFPESDVTKEKTMEVPILSGGKKIFRFYAPWVKMFISIKWKENTFFHREGGPLVFATFYKDDSFTIAFGRNVTYKISSSYVYDPRVAGIKKGGNTLGFVSNRIGIF